MVHQCQLLGVQGVVQTSWELRKEVCNTLKCVPNRFRWVNIHFNGNWDEYRTFIALHQQNKEWTDDIGVMVAATALYLGKTMFTFNYLEFLDQNIFRT